MVNVGIMGGRGRMGGEILKLALADETVNVVAVWEAKGHPDIGKSLRELGIGERDLVIDIFPSNLPDVDVIIDFTTPSATREVISEAKRLKKNVVVGTTGLSEEDKEEIRSASEKIAIVFSPNMSLGVNLLFVLTQIAVSVLPDEYEIEIIESHHHHKKDAPSGTAMKLWEIVKAGRGLSDSDAVFGRKGIVGSRRKNEVGIHSIRCADIVGEHVVLFGIEGERIELVHKASSRQAFARGAILAAKFLSQEKQGLYDMMDVMGLKAIFG